MEIIKEPINEVVDRIVSHANPRTDAHVFKAVGYVMPVNGAHKSTPVQVTESNMVNSDEYRIFYTSARSGSGKEYPVAIILSIGGETSITPSLGVERDPKTAKSYRKMMRVAQGV